MTVIKLFFLISVILCIFKQSSASSDVTNLILLSDRPNIKSEKFQVNFINEMSLAVDRNIQSILNELLLELQKEAAFVTYEEQLQTSLQSQKLEQKIIFLKQLLDMKFTENVHNLESFYTLRNLNFLAKLKKQLQQMQEESTKEMRNLRWYNLCKQFWFRFEVNSDNNNKTSTIAGEATEAQPEEHKPPHYYYSPHTLLAPIATSTQSTPSTTSVLDTVPTTTQAPLSVNLEEFGGSLYDRVKIIGSEIIDDYLRSLRQILQEVIDEKHEHEQHAAKLSKVLTEIDVILGVTDFYEKRQRLYAYLENTLAGDYEEFRNTAYAQEDLAVILTKLKSKGFDLFVAFIFSNFEFLEHLHEEWAVLLPHEEAGKQYDDITRLLFRIRHTYETFKRDSENTAKYDAYVEHVKDLYTRTKSGSKNMHIFELLHNASLNVGTVTFNMIKSKCDEI